MIYSVNSFPVYFAATLAGTKTHEIRNPTEDGVSIYSVGDILILKEYDPSTQTYSGRTCMVQITWMSTTQPESWEVTGYVYLSTKFLAQLS